MVDVYYGASDKVTVFQDFLDLYEGDIKAEEVLFMGDDLVDLELMRLVGLPCCPSDACPEILQLSTYVSHAKGGQGGGP